MSGALSLRTLPHPAGPTFSSWERQGAYYLQFTSSSVSLLAYRSLLMVSVGPWSFVAPNGTSALGPSVFSLHCLLEVHF